MTESIIIETFGLVKTEPQDDQNPSNSSSQPSTAVTTLILQIQNLLENWKTKNGSNDCNFEPELSHSETDRAIEIKIVISKNLNFEMFDPVIKPGPDEIEPTIIPLRSKLEKINVDGYEFYEIPDKISHNSSSNITKIQCRFCSRSFKQLKSLVTHEKRHFDCKKLTCKICGLNQLRTYQSNLSKLERDYVCSLCENLDVIHDKNPSEPEPKPPRFLPKFRLVNGVKLYECDFCGRDDFSLKRLLLRHRRSHASRVKLFCDRCDFTADSKTALSFHKNSRHIVKKFMCDLCGRRYHLKCLIQTHVDSFHLQKKIYCCQYCGKSFTRYDTLFVHLKSHTSGKNVICDICGSRFYAKDKLRRHMGSHLDVCRFSCDICGKKFKRNDKIKTHKLVMHFGGMKTVHGEPLKCTICRKEYKRISAVREHMWNVHNKRVKAAEIMNFK